MSNVVALHKRTNLFDIALKRIQEENEQTVQTLEMHRSDIDRFERFCAILMDAGLDVTPKIMPLPWEVYFLINSTFQEHSREIVTTIRALGCKDFGAEAHENHETIHFSGPDTPNFTLRITAPGAAPEHAERYPRVPA